jgi:uncharacterized repeat protein (TIGR03843 family)
VPAAPEPLVPGTADGPLDDAAIEQVLSTGRVQVQGRLAAASNATFLATAELDGLTCACVYKPVRGERPLWDFPDGTLAAREVATYEVARLLGWDVLPPTVMGEGPFGPGMLQLWVEEDPEQAMVDIVRPHEIEPGWLRVLDALDARDQPVSLVHADDPRLRRLAVFDAVVNNADRKGGHVLVSGNGEVRGCDHGVTFAVEDKLRTVLWGWAGEPLADADADGLRCLRTALASDQAAVLVPLLTPDERSRLRWRVERLLRRGRHPMPRSDWHAIPWPAF